MMTKLTGDTPFEMVNHATGKLASKLQELIMEHEDSSQVLELAKDFISWWNMPFDDPEKEAIGRTLWDRADQLKDGEPPITMTKLERAGTIIGNSIGAASGATANVTIAGSKATAKWMKGSAAPAVKAGSVEFWKGLKATAKATRESYRQSRANNKSTETETDEELPY